jgi:transcription antitermination factor NusG
MSSALWYALKVRSRSEWAVARNLQGKDYEVFLPTYLMKRRWSDRVISSEVPLFAGYLFCRFDVQRRLPILATPGVQLIVGSARVPEPVADSEIQGIRLIVESGNVYEPYPYLSVGAAIRITEGPLAGLTGIALRIKSNFRLVASVHLLQRSVAVELDRAVVEPVAPARADAPLQKVVGI